MLVVISRAVNEEDIYVSGNISCSECKNAFQTGDRFIKIFDPTKINWVHLACHRDYSNGYKAGIQWAIEQLRSESSSSGPCLGCSWADWLEKRAKEVK